MFFLYLGPEFNAFLSPWVWEIPTVRNILWKESRTRNFWFLLNIVCVCKLSLRSQRRLFLLRISLSWPWIYFVVVLWCEWVSDHLLIAALLHSVLYWGQGSMQYEQQKSCLITWCTNRKGPLTIDLWPLDDLAINQFRSQYTKSEAKFISATFSSKMYIKFPSLSASWSSIPTKSTMLSNIALSRPSQVSHACQKAANVRKAREAKARSALGSAASIGRSVGLSSAFDQSMFLLHKKSKYKRRSIAGTPCQRPSS